MSRARRLLLWSLLLLSGCRGGPVQPDTDRAILELASHPFDLAPAEPTESKPKTEELPPPTKAASAEAAETDSDVQTVALLQADRAQEKKELPKYELKMPPGLPGSEAPLLPQFAKLTPAQKQQAIRQLYPELPPLPEQPTPQPGPDGRPYTLADLQRLAAENSPTLRQAASDVKNAQGALIQAKTYTNPTLGYSASPTNNNSNAGAQGAFLTQHITMWGKRPLAVAAAQKSLDNAVLALRRARSDLSTSVRNAYFALIVAQETVRVNRALARFTDEIYRLYTGYVAFGGFAPYEPAPLRSQAYAVRLAYQQAIYGYISAWKQLVATLGLPQLPLTEVSGRIDRLIPYYEYDKVLAYVLANHTDVLTARNGVDIARYNLKLAQITPWPDMDWYGAVWKESTIPPYVIFYSVQTSFPIPIWDRNKGNIISAQAQLIRAVEESHRVEMFWTNTLAASYANYQNSLKALEYYRRYILPDQVRYYRGVFERRQADPAASPGDLVTAQQALTANVQAYLGILGSLWTAVVSVADPLQTDDLFQMAQPRELPELPDLDKLPHWLCPHHRQGILSVPGAGPNCPPAVPAAKPTQLPDADPVLPAPRKAAESPAPSPPAEQCPKAKAADLTQQLLEPPPDIPKRMKDEG